MPTDFETIAGFVVAAIIAAVIVWTLAYKSARS